MAKDRDEEKEKWEKDWEKKWEGKWGKKKWHRGTSGAFGFFYFVTFIGTATYYLHQTVGFWPGVLDILKAIVWPAFLIYKVFTLLGM